ncbi:MAG: hypothetical protein JSV66_09640 [Trueperaceae bacterium]|nr:MAG: hypothetical protein JSV66_09640 [Trueperaceae bacterium]
MNTCRTSEITQGTDRRLRTHLVQKGLKKGDLLRFVEGAVQERATARFRAVVG